MKISVITPSIRPKGLEITQKCLAEQTFQDFEWLVEIGIPERGNDLSRALNRMIRRSKGEYIVMLQDNIKIGKDGLEKFLEVANEKKLICGAGGKTTDWENVKYDWREAGEYREVDYMKWEGDWAIAPRKAFLDVGGYDEEYDNHWSFDNVEIAFRMSKLGYTFWVLPDNKSIHYDHDKFEKHPYRDKFNKSIATPRWYYS